MKKIGIIGLAIIIALGALGVGFAAWQQTLVVNGTVKTGTFDVQFVNPQILSGNQDPNATFTLTPTDAHNFSINLENGYPGYTASFIVNVHNEGTVPAWVTVASSNAGSANYQIEWHEIYNGVDWTIPDLMNVDGYGIPFGDIAWTAPYDTADFPFSLKGIITIPTDTTYENSSFTVTLNAAQFY